jgi:hypothetical protein
MSFLGELESFGGMLQGLPGMLMSGLVIFLAMVHGSRTVRMCDEFMELGSSLMRVVWHSATHPRPPADANSSRFIGLFNCEQ